MSEQSHRFVNGVFMIWNAMLLKMASQQKSSQCPFLSTKNDDMFSLSERINLSTRVIHTQLNRLIIARLPLALPPHTLNPSAYVSGMLHIAPIYITFESLWQKILDAPNYEAKGDGQICSTLAHLRLPEVLRSGRLRGDIKTLSGVSEHEVEEQLLKISQNSRISELIAHTTKSVNAKPHVLLAYVWVMYMALFSGGRYIRASLQDAGPEFWSRSPSPGRSCPHSLARNNSRGLFRKFSTSESQSTAVNQVLQFFHFVGEEDGEDIKTELKTRFAEAEIALSSSEKDEIVQEAQQIFRFMVEMVGELDRVCGSTDEKNAQLATMTGLGGVCIAGKAPSEKQDSRAEEHNSLSPIFFQNLREITRAAWPMVRFGDIFSAVHLQVPRSRFLGTGSPAAHKQNSRIGGAGTTFLLFIIFLVLAIVVW